MSQIEIFYSYSHKDEQYREELERQLSLLQRQGVIANWTDRRILAGQEWAGEIDKHLDTAQIILLLISPDFMASSYCYSIEMQRAMERHERGEAHVIPVILRYVHWQDAPFGKLQALPTDAKPVKSWLDQDEAFYSVAAGIRKVVKELQAKHPNVSAKPVEQPAVPLISPLPPSPERFSQPEKIEIAPPASLPVTQNIKTFSLKHVLIGHSDIINCVAISPNGQTIVSGSDDKTIRVWDSRSGKLLRVLKAHTGEIIFGIGVLSVAISPDGQTLMSGGGDKTVRVWNLPSGEQLRTLTGHEDWVRSVAVSPDGRTPVSGSDDKTIKVWNLPSGELLQTLTGHEGGVLSVAISPDGQSIISGSADKTIRVWGV